MPRLLTCADYLTTLNAEVTKKYISLVLVADGNVLGGPRDDNGSSFVTP